MASLRHNHMLRTITVCRLTSCYAVSSWRYNIWLREMSRQHKRYNKSISRGMLAGMVNEEQRARAKRVTGEKAAYTPMASAITGQRRWLVGHIIVGIGHRPAQMVIILLGEIGCEHGINIGIGYHWDHHWQHNIIILIRHCIVYITNSSLYFYIYLFLSFRAEHFTLRHIIFLHLSSFPFIIIISRHIYRR